MAIPADPVLRAATRWLELLPRSGARRCRALFTTYGEYSDITPTQYEAAYAWLESVGLLADLHSLLPARRRVFGSAIADAGTAWFPDAGLLIHGPDELPEDALRAAAILDLEESEAYAHILSAWGKVDLAERERVGAAGEAVLLDILSEGLDASIQHVSQLSDGYGYDIAVRAKQCSMNIEVKSTTRRGRLTFYLSRHEFETMTTDVNWQLVIVRLDSDLNALAIAGVRRDWISCEVPRDGGAYGRWESCRIEVPPNALDPGIPALTSVFKTGVPAILATGGSW